MGIPVPQKTQLEGAQTCGTNDGLAWPHRTNGGFAWLYRTNSGLDQPRRTYGDFDWPGRNQ